MINKIKIAPSILSGDFANMGESVKNVCEWGADLVHCDVMDGVFVPNITFGMPMVKSLKKYSTIPLDVHLMIVKPEKYIGQFIDAGADYISFHPSECADVDKTLDYIKSRGVKAGLVINPDVDINVVFPYLNKLDIITLMGVFPGFGGQSFIESVYKKISDMSKKIKESGRDIELELDGGVTEENIDEMLRRGITVVVGGSSVFKSKDPAKTVRRLRG